MKIFQNIILLSTLIIHFANASTTQVEKTAASITLLKNYFSQDLKDHNLICTHFTPFCNLTDKDKKQYIFNLEKELVEIRSSEKTDKQVEILIVLKLDYLKLKKEEISKINRAIENKEIIRKQELINLSKGIEVRKNKESLNLAISSLQSILKRDMSPRDKIIFGSLFSVYSKTESLNMSENSLNTIRNNYLKLVSGWSDLEKKISNTLEDQVSNIGAMAFTGYSEELHMRLDTVNSALFSKGSFENKIFNEYVAPSELEESKSFQIRDEDNDRTRKAIEMLRAARINYLATREVVLAEKESLFREILKWSKSYKDHILDLRGAILSSSINGNKKIFKPQQSLLIEWQTIATNFTLLYWASEYIGSDEPLKGSQGEWKFLGTAFRLVKISAILLILFFLLFKRKKILKVIEKNLRKSMPKYSRKKFFQWSMDVLDDLYTFLIVLFVGNKTIDFLVGFGMDAAKNFRPHLSNILYFFLIWGFINLTKNIISQRRGFSRNLDEVLAMEKTFELLPKMILLYWLFISTVSILLFQSLSFSLSQHYVDDFFPVILFLIFIFGVWLQKKSWRLVSKKSVNSERWNKILLKSEGKFWEPFVLVLGGGIGVYLLAWKVAKHQLGELRFTRSFQAMVSRALLERNKRNSIVRVSNVNFPEGYIAAFDLDREFDESFYIKREESEAEFIEFFNSWKEGKRGLKILLTGDRGAGKSTFVKHMMTKLDSTYIDLELEQSDTSIRNVEKRLCAAFGIVYSDGVDILDHLDQMEPSVVFLGNFENSLLREVDGFKAFSYLIDLILKTSNKHFWVATITTFAWSIGKSAIPGADCFSRKVHIDGFSEEEIYSLIMKRHGASGNLALNFDELSFDSKVDKSLSKQELEEKRKKLYFRILWDYTEGNPRQALYFWKTSLSHINNTLRVKLFDIPEQKYLGELRDRALMTLAAIVEHNGMTIGNLSEVMNESEDSIFRMLEELAPNGILYSLHPNDEKRQSWHLESFWMRTAEKYLEKRQLLFRGGLK